MSARWSTARATAIASALAIGGSAVVAMPAVAAPGEANASAVKMQLSLELGRTVLLDVDAATATKAPPAGEVVIPDLAAHLGTLKGATAAGAATLTTSSDTAGSGSSAVVEDLSVSVLGVNALSADRVSSSADCGVGELPAAETDAQGVTVLGTEVVAADLPPEGIEVKATTAVPGMTRAEVIAKVRPGTASSNASSAKVSGLSVNLLLKGKVTEVGEIASIWLGRVSTGDVDCDRVDDAAAPTAEELTPADGVTTGGDTVTMRGTGFTSDTKVTVGAKEASDVVVLSDTRLTFRTPANPAGPAVVAATTPSGTTNTLEFTYNEPAPEIPEVEELDPDEVAATGGEEVWVFGSGFVSGRTSVTVGDRVISPSDVEVMNSGALIIKAPAHAAGTAPVSVTTPVGTSGTMDLTYLAVTVPPAITSSSPNSGPLAGGNVVTLRGTGFVQGATSVTMDTASFLDDDVTVVSDTELSFITPPGTEGPVTIFITTPAGTSNEVTYTYTEAAIPTAPKAVSLTPTSGPAAGGTPITVTGEGFLPGETAVTIGGANIPAGNVTVTSATELSFTTPAHAAGAAEVVITTPDGTSNALSYTYQAAPPPPSASIEGHDFSGDGNADVLARDSRGNLWLYSGNGKGGWLKKTQAGSGWNSMSSIVAPGDFDGDKNADLLARDSRGNLWLYSGNGKGGWLKKTQAGSGWNSMSSIVAPGDFDGDKNADLLARDSRGNLWLYSGNGKGGWLKKTQAGSGWNSMSSIVAPGDFDGDKNADLMARDSRGNLWLYSGNGKGGWLKKTQAGSGWNSMTSIVGPGDFDGDDKTDVLARDSRGNLWLYAGNGKGGWLKKAPAGTGWQTMTSII